MADTKISALTAATSLAGTDEFVIATAGASKKVTLTTFLTSLPIVLLHEETLGADTASFDVTSISGNYKHLKLIFQLRGTTAAGTVALNMRFNNDSGANYYRERFDVAAGSTASDADSGTTSFVDAASIAASTATANKATSGEILIPNYATTTFFKEYVLAMHTSSSNVDGGQLLRFSGGTWNSTAAITRVTIFPASDNLLAGSRLTIYGLN